MKRLVLFLFLLSINSLFSQMMNIHVFKVQSFFGDTTESMQTILSKPAEDSSRIVNCEYVLDIQHLTCIFYKNNKFIGKDPISIFAKDSVYQISFLNEPFNYGLLINLVSNTCTLYDIDDFRIEYMKFIDFEYTIVK